MNTSHKPVQSNQHMISRPVTCRSKLPSNMSFEYSRHQRDPVYLAVFTIARAQVLFRPVQFSSVRTPTLVRSILILSLICAYGLYMVSHFKALRILISSPFCYMSHPSYSSWFHSNNGIRRKTHITTFLRT